MRWALLGDGGAVEGIAPLLDRFDHRTTRPPSSTPRDAMALERTIMTEVVSELGISVNFSDADGDG